MNYSKIIYDNSWIFMIIRVEKKKNTNTHEYTRIRNNIIYDNSWIFMIIRVEKRLTRIHMNTHEYEKINYL